MSAFVVRRATADDAAAMGRMHVDSARAAYAGILPADHLAGLDPADRARRWREALLAGDRAFVALEGTRLIGLADGGRSRDAGLSCDGELYAIYVDPARLRGGVGRALFLAVAGMLHAEGFASMMLWVLKANPACRFYERLGGEILHERQAVIGGATCDELAYGWRSLAPFA